MYTKEKEQQPPPKSGMLRDLESIVRNTELEWKTSPSEG